MVYSNLIVCWFSDEFSIVKATDWERKRKREGKEGREKENVFYYLKNFSVSFYVLLCDTLARGQPELPAGSKRTTWAEIALHQHPQYKTHKILRRKWTVLNLEKKMDSTKSWEENGQF